MILTSFAIILRIFSNSLSNVYQKQLTSKGLNAFFINFIMYFGLVILCIPIVLNTNFSNLNYSVWLYSVSGGLLGALGNSYLVKALDKGELSVLGPVNAYKPVAAMIFGILFLSEIPSLKGILAILLIIYGSYVIFDTQEEGFSYKLLKRKDIQYRIYALVFTAAEAVFIKNVIILTDIKISFFLWCFWGMIFTGLAVLKIIRFNLKNVSAVYAVSNNKLCVITGLVKIILCMGLMQYCTNYVFSKINVSYGLALFQLSTVLNVILGRHYFNETKILKKISGCLIMAAGAVILILLK